MPLGLATLLVAWSGVLLADGPGGVADDMGITTPRRHAPRRKPLPKKPGKKPKRAPDAGVSVDAAPSLGICPTTSPDASAQVADGQRGTLHPADDDEDDDDDEDAAAASAGPEGGTPRRPRRSKRDGGTDAGTDEDDDDDDADADDDKTAYELGLEVATESRLVWRGLAESRGAVLQSSAWAGIYGLRLEGWASYLLNTEGPFNPMTVVGADLSASYTLYLGGLRIGPGIALLYFPEGLSSSATAEASLGASYRFGDFRVVNATNIDVSIAPGAYFGTLGLIWERAKPPWTVKGLADVSWATARYNAEYLARNVDAIDVVHGGMSARYDVGSVLYFELHLDVSGLVAPTLAGSVQEPVLIVGGAAVGLDWSVAR